MRKRNRYRRRPLGPTIVVAIIRGKRRTALPVELVSPLKAWEDGYDPALVTVRTEHGTEFKCGRKAIIC